MKRKVCALLLLCIGLSSCVTTYDSATMHKNYDERMHKSIQIPIVNKTVWESKKGAELYDRIPVYLSEKDIDKEFDVIALGVYHPWVLPIIRPEKPRLMKHLYKKAVKRANKLNGDAVIIDDKNSFKVIKYKN
ncbi:hypothetical protein LJC29_03980 [Bacteroides sp. OttesenSCG-928-N06]|nr:hypothetical protein [Bacteroides sp. OttesenSCG-928-N06]